MRKKYHIKQNVILRKNMKLGQIIKLLPNDDSKYVVSYYENNILKYDVITELDIVDNKEYEKIKKRIDIINKILL